MGVVVGSVDIPGSPANFSVTGMVFEPVAVLMFTQYEDLGAHSFTMGCASGPSEQWSIWTGTATELAGYNARKREGRTDACAFHRNSVTDAIQWQVSFVSLNSDGFTLSLDVLNDVGTSEGAKIYWMAVGGDHISDAYAGTVDAGASTGTVATTDPGFLPTSVIFAHVGNATFDSGIVGHQQVGTGVADGTTQFSSYAATNQGTAVSVRHIYRTDAVACYYDLSNTIRVALDSLDANGFTLDVQSAAFDITHGYLAINADGAVAGHDVQPDSNTTTNHSTPGLSPEGVFFCWPGVDSPSTSGSSAAPMRPGVGAGTIPQERMSAGISRSSAPFGVWTSDGYQIPTESMGFWGVGDGIVGGSNQSQATANLSSVQLGSFDLTWSTVLDTNDRVYGWLALPGELQFHWVPNLYRRQQL